MHNNSITVHIRTVCLCNLYTATCFDTFMSPSDSSQTIPCFVANILNTAADENTIYKIKIFLNKLHISSQTVDVQITVFENY
jgi:hypothetical protein